MAASQAREALAAAAGSRRGHEPWLFYPRDGHWRWWSFARGWTEVERWRAVLERGEGPAGGAIPAPESSPEALCFHVAASTEAIAAFDRLLALDLSAREIVVVTPPAGAEAAAPAARLARLWLDWCCANLAVLALEPSRQALVGSVLWCRPTTMLVDAEQERSLAAAVVERSCGRDRRAAGLLDRLRLLLVAAGDGDDDGEVRPPPARWRAWGVERRVVGELDSFFLE
ncbi:MAG: hypothetical protein F4060_15465 [Holophagales bacterium]|nr:hypothetical protein [Holophagales bacterium]MYG31394.1 hypothetical protein [Holophagales bacterium]MYI81327.1 hypothetical protein [Holophagales bacterium]